MKAAALTLSQLRYVNKAYRRSPAQAFFAFAYPLMFLVIFTSIFRNSDVQFGATRVNEVTFYVPAMAALAVITVCFNNIAVAVTFQRDSGVLKRIDGTPLPSRSFFGARILHAVLVSALLVAITAAFGRALDSADIPSGLTLLRMLAMLAVGAAAFCALGFAISSVIPNADASRGRWLSQLESGLCPVMPDTYRSALRMFLPESLTCSPTWRPAAAIRCQRPLSCRDRLPVVRP
jgi:ABC-2 type transport system permease protein